jgi:hypothetical protein
VKKFVAFVLVLSFLISAVGTVTLHAANVIPSGGGVVQVNGTTSYSFTPNRSGFWTFETSNNGSSDPCLLLRDENNRVIAEDDDGAGGLNAHIMVRLEQGRTYTLVARFFSGNTGQYTLTVNHMAMSEIPGRNQTLPVETETYFSFTPTETGLWSFAATNHEGGGNIPAFWIYDIAGRQVNMNHEHMTARLTAGVEYILRAGFLGSNKGYFTLNIARVPATEITGSGEMFKINNGGYFSFTPRESGFWAFYTNDNGSSDPLLSLYDFRGIIADDDDSGEEYNAYLLVPLEAGVQYFLHAGFWSGGGNYTLYVERAPYPASRVSNPQNLFETYVHRADRPAWMTDVRFQNHNRSFVGRNGEWEAAARELLENKDAVSRGVSLMSLATQPVTNAFSNTAREAVRAGIAADSYFDQFPFNREYISEIILSHLGFYFPSGEFGGGMYIGRENFSTIVMDLGRDINWVVAVFGHEVAHALAMGESLSDFVEEGLMGWQFSTQGRGAAAANPLGIQNAHGLMYNSTFDRTLERLAGPEEFWFYASFSNNAYGELWNRHLSHAVTFREMQVLRSVMDYCDTYPMLGIQLERITNMTTDAFSEQILSYWRTVFVEPHPSNNFGTTPPTQAEQQRAQQNLNRHMETVMNFAAQFNIAPTHAVLTHVQNNHRSRLNDGK